jgi:hypothetical protein
MIVIHHQKRNSHHVSKSWNRFVSVSPEPEMNRSEHKKAKIEAPESVAARKSSKSVRFADFNESYECDKSLEEVSSTWLTRQEISTIKESNKKTANLIEHGLPFIDCKDHCARGLEHRIPERFQERRSNRRNAFQAVVEAQECFSADYEMIATAYKSCVSHCRQDALDRGSTDAKDAAAIASHRSLSSILGFLRLSPPTLSKERKVLGEIQVTHKLSSPEMADKLESGSSVSRCRVYSIQRAL